MLAANPSSRPLADCLGISVSAACAVHCAIGPLITILAPTFATWWSTPLVHILGAMLVVPVALVAMHRGRQQHGRRWPQRYGWIGSAVICLALLPWWATLTPVTWSWGMPSASTCEHSSCCPALVTSPDGGSIVLPWPTLLTIAGSLLLITGHLSNLRGLCCRPADDNASERP